MIRFLMPRSVAAVAVAVAAAALGGGASASASEKGDADPSQAVFDGSTIDLSADWGRATACAELGEIVECFRSEAELLATHPELALRPASTAVAAAAACSSSLRLHREPGHSGGTLYLTSRLTGHNLSSYGFDNDTSSYQVGGCPAAFYSGPNLGGSTYPGATGAYASASSMSGGWNNVVSSVIIY